jgi:hypothetical protein
VADLAADAQIKQAKAVETMARVDLMQQEIVDKAVAAMYSAFQAAGLAVNNPDIASAGDSLLKAAGWKDRGEMAAAAGGLSAGDGMAEAGPTDAVAASSANPDELAPAGMGSDMPLEPQPSAPSNSAGMTAGMNVGMNAGIETPAIGDGAQ